MLYKYILDDSIKNPTPILTADHLTWPKKGLPFSSVGESLQDHGLIFAWPSPPPFNGPFFVTPPFSVSQKVVTLPLFPPPPPPLPPANFWQVPYYVFLYCQWMDSGVTGVRGRLVVKHAIVGYRLELVYAITPLSRPEEKTVKVRHQTQSPVWIVIVQVSLYNGS